MNFGQIKRKLLAHLQNQLDPEELSKALAVNEILEKAVYPVGTIRVWKGKKYIKTAPGKWQRKFDSAGRGTNQAIKGIMRKINEAKTPEDLYQIVMQNQSRFRDEDGRMLPEVQQLHDLVRGKQLQMEQEDSVKNDRIKNSLNNKDKVQMVKKLYGEIYDGDNTDPSKFAVYHTNGKVKGIAMTQDIADIINSHTEVDVYDWAKAIAKDVHAKYPKIKEEYVSFIVTSIRMGYRKGKKEHVMIIKDTEEDRKPKPKDKIPQKKKKTSGIEAIKEKYNSSQSVDGDEDEIYVGGETISGKWKLVEADAPSASHDEKTFQKTKGFPTDKAGGTINDRDYEHDKAAQEAVIDMAGSYDGRALSFDSPIVVTKDGVVISGNNRTMSSKIAARKGTDTKYIEALKKRAKKFGFTADDVAKFKNPRVVFETDSNEAYSTEQFAKFNRSGKKAMDPIESAVKVSKTIKPYTVEEVASTISEFDTLGELYADKKSCSKVFNAMIDGGLIQKTDLPAYFTDSGITGAGKEFLETVMIGSVIDETNIRQLNTEGAKSVRQKLVRAITPLIENKGMNGYSINKELNDAVRIAIEVSKNKDKYPSVEEFSKQQDLFRKLDPVALELAKKMEGTQKGFAEFMQSMNGGLRPAANGEADIFFGGVETKEQIVNRFLGLKKSVQAILSQVYSFKSAVFHNLRGCQ